MIKCSVCSSFLRRRINAFVKPTLESSVVELLVKALLNKMDREAVDVEKDLNTQQYTLFFKTPL